MSEFTPFDPCPFCKGTGKQIGDDCRHCGGEGTVVKSSVRYATPEMYEALKAHQAARNHHKDCIRCDWEPCQEWWELYWIAVELTDTSLAKAEGRTEDV